ncbi:MAG: PQQ-binding-like beta-propeller repeat protein [Nocardioides sp.]|uniref:outer membrane protein assembly factor BamB family protein n=1 Tax=Nocardioides sp. TaxID=35761 RepID=UPI003D6C4AC6
MQPASPSPTERPDHTTLWVIGGLILALIVAVAGYLVYTELQGDGDATGPVTVTSEPKEVWAWTSDQEVAYAQDLPDGGALVSLSGEADGIVALDKSGKEVWRDEKHPYNIVTVHEKEQLIEASWYVARASSSGSSSDSGTILFDFDGEVTWEAPEGADLYSIEEDGTYLLYDDDSMTRLNPKTDEESWTIKGSGFTLSTSAVYALDGDDIVRYSLDGKEEWRTTLPAGHDDGLDEYGLTHLYSSGEMLLVDSGSLLAFAPGTGEHLWTEAVRGEAIRAADDRFVVVPTTEYDPDTGAKQPVEGPFPIFGPDGHDGDIDLATSGAYRTMDVITLDGRLVNFHQPSGILFDADGTVIDTGYDHVGEAFDDGGYTVDGSTIGYRAWNSEKAAWALDLDDVDSLADDYYPEDVRVGSSANGVYVTDKTSVRLYR